ncbi:MAG TPA: hypothetical protein VL095_15975 [Flavisolibacter sp.]|nr:hypothetical protein [Flavisolibacter sp.]
MKQNKIFTLLMALGVTAFISCNDSSDTTADNADSTGATNTAEVNTSASNYSAYADEIEKNSSEGNYVNPKTGKAYGKLTVNRENGEITDENNEPVWRYVDKRTWWVYGVDDDWNWTKLGEAKMDKDQLVYKDNSGNWVSYDKAWSTNDETINKTWKAKSGDAKIKFDKDGDIKYKDDSTKLKYDADDNKIKTDSSK